MTGHTVRTVDGTLHGRAVELGPESRVIARQQLRDPAFYQAVKAGLLDGTITAVDQRQDALVIDGEQVPLTDERALRALATSQAQWVGKPPADPYLPGLLRNRT